MTGLQEAFYIVGLIYMGVMLVLVIALVVGVFVIRAKINKIHDNIEAKIDSFTNIAEKGGEIAAAVSGAAVRKAKRALNRK
jgi:nucleoside recognition membrane protein YjiH